MEQSSKLYVLVSNKYPLAYQGVQGGHAVAEWLLNNRQQTEWDNDTLVYLACKDIGHWWHKLQHYGINPVTWHEPDQKNELTAMAVLGHGELFKNLSLMGK